MTLQNFWIPSSVILLVGYLTYMGIWVILKTIEKNKKEN